MEAGSVDDRWAEFGKYRILGELGRGGMGVVYLAEDGLLNRRVALKVLHQHLNRESEFVSRFRDEARSVSSLHHRNIVCVHGMERAEDAFAIDMEYVEGLSLDRFSAASRISLPLAARLGSDILEGLVVCHSIGIVHRDIKPSNILVGQDSVAKITDFGLATAYALHVKTSITSGTSSGLFMGTPRYASPAAWDGQTPVPAWDLYSLGVILFELLTGKVAFAGETPMAIMKQHLTVGLPPVSQLVPEVSRELASVVERLLESRDPPASATSEEILMALQDTPEYDIARRSDSTSTISMAVRRHKFRRGARKAGPWVTRALALSALVVLVAVLTWMLKGIGDDPPPPVDRVASRMDAPQVILRPQSINGATQDNTLWMLSNNEKGIPQRIIALNALGLWHLELEPTPEGNRYKVKGSWAEYLRDGNARVLLGESAGFVLIAREEGYLSLAIDLVNERDNLREQLNLVAKPVPETNSQSKFVQALESSAAVQSLLYNELLPRDFAWALDIEALMPGFVNGRIEVPGTSADIMIDGKLNELTWTRPPFNAGGRLGEIPQRESGESRLLVRWTPTAVVIGIDAENVPPGAQLDIGLLPGVEISSQNSRRYFASLSVEGLSKTRSTAGARELPWECDWQGVATVRDGRYQAEIQIPIGQFSALSAPGDDRRWRINVVLNGTTGGDPIAYWGQKDGRAPEHGALITFREAKS